MDVLRSKRMYKIVMFASLKILRMKIKLSNFYIVDWIFAALLIFDEKLFHRVVE